MVPACPLVSATYGNMFILHLGSRDLIYMETHVQSAYKRIRTFFSVSMTSTPPKTLPKPKLRLPSRVLNYFIIKNMFSCGRAFVKFTTCEYKYCQWIAQKTVFISFCFWCTGITIKRTYIPSNSRKEKSSNQGNQEREREIPGSCHGSQVCKSISTRVPMRSGSFAIFLYK